jgi:hypothetical protein
MDAVAASGSQHPQSDWMTAMGEQQAEGGLADAPSQLNASEASSGSASIDAPAESSRPLHSAGEEPFFAEEPKADEPTKSFFVPESPAPEVTEEFDARPFETAGFPATQFFPSEIDRASTNPILFKDPALVEPPAARVTPEPLLVNEEPRQSPEYGSHAEELPPTHSFFVPERDQAIAEQSPARDAEPHSVPAPLPSDAADVDERVPTSHPPNREALADIPFLVPPPGFRPDATPESAASSDTVDAVVHKVLEKLEPQLHELLSQGVLKPLVESLLQGELAKKER